MPKKPEKIQTVTAKVPHGHGKGGQSQNRFQRLQDEATHVYLKRLAESTKAYFDANPVDHIIIGGPGLLKNDFIDHYIDPSLAAKIIYIADTGNGGTYGIRDLLNKAMEDHVMENTAYAGERKIVSMFIAEISKNGLAEYGEHEVRSAIDEGRVEHLLISEKIKQDIIDDLAEQALKTGVVVTIISMATEEGVMFGKGFTGIGAFLRWKKQ